jgi:hypothetical protein
MFFQKNKFRLFLALVLFGLICIPVSAAPPPEVKHVSFIDRGNPNLIQQTDMPTFHCAAAAGARNCEAWWFGWF